MGDSYTCARCGVHGFVASKLDRVFCSQFGLDSWDTISCIILWRFCLDNYHLLLKFYDHRRVGLTPFRFQSMWIKDDSFLSAVSLAWKIQVSRNPLLQIIMRLNWVK